MLASLWLGVVLATGLLANAKFVPCSSCGVDGQEICRGDTPTRAARAVEYEGKVLYASAIYQDQMPEGSEEGSMAKTWTCVHDGVRSPQCEELCAVGELEGHCTGDEEYCAERKCAEGAPCRCKRKMIKERILARLPGRSAVVPVKEVPCRSGWQMTRERLKRDMDPEYDPQGTINTIVTQVFISRDGAELVFNVVPETNTMTRLSLGDWVIIFRKHSSRFSYVLPQPIMSQGGLLKVEVWSATTLIKQKEFEIEAPDVCSVKNNCVLCWEVYENFWCIPTTLKIFVVFATILMFVLLAALAMPAASCLWTSAKMMYWGIKWFFWSLFNCHKMKVTRSVRKYVADKARAAREATEVEVTEDVEAAPRSRQEFRYTVQNGALVKIPVLLAMIIGAVGVSACDYSYSGALTIDECQGSTESGVTSQCKVSVNEEIDMVKPGTKSCFELSDQDKKRQLHIELEWLTAKAKAVPSRDYYTSDWEGIEHSAFACPATEHCSSIGAQTCGEVASDDTTAYDQLSGETLDYPGRTDCRSGSIYPFHCFFAAPVCVYGRYTIKPKGYSYEVHRITEIEKVHRVRLTVDDQNRRIYDETFDLDASEPEALNALPPHTVNHSNPILSSPTSFSIGFIGEFADAHISEAFGHLIFNRRDEVRTGHVSEKGIPVKNTFGDIQGGNELDDHVPETDMFIYDPTMVLRKTVNHDAKYQFEKPGFRHYANMTKFPMEVNGDVWVVTIDTMDVMIPGFRKREAMPIDGSFFYLTTNMTRPGAIKMFFNTDSLIIEQTIDAVCPVVQNATVEGCFDCDEHPVVTFKAKSDCEPGIASPGVRQVEGSTWEGEVLNNFVRLSETLETHTVKLRSETQVVNGELCLSAHSRVACTKLVGSLTKRMENLGDSTQTMSAANSTTSESSSPAHPWSFLGAVEDAFVAAFGGSGTLLHWLQVAGVIVAGVVAVVVIVFVAYWAITAYCSWSSWQALRGKNS